MLKYRDTPNEMVGLIISEELHLNCQRNEIGNYIIGYPLSHYCLENG